MSRRLRIALNILAWAAFLVIAPFLISYSLGRKISPISTQTGTVGTFLVRSIPGGASISVNKNIISTKTPGAIQNLLPGNYDLELSKDGYKPWTKSLPISGTMITDVRDVRLIPEKIEEDVMRGNVVDFYLSPKRQILAVLEDSKNNRRIRILPLRNFADTGIVADLVLNRQDKIQWFWSPDEDLAVLTLTSGKSSQNILLDLKTGKTNLLPEENVQIAGWISDFTGEKILKLKGEKAILSSFQNDGTETISESALQTSFSNAGFALLEKDETQNYVIRTFSSSGRETDKIYPPDSTKDGINNIFLSPKGDIALLAQPNQKLFIWDNEERFWHEITDHAENVVWSPEGDKISWQESAFDLWAMNLHEKRSVLSPYIPELMARISTAIRKPIWYAGSHHLIFLERDNVNMIELDPRSGHRMESIISTNRGDGNLEIVENGDLIIAAVQHENQLVLSRFFMLTQPDR